MPRFNALTDQDRGNAYPGDSADTQAMLDAVAAFGIEVLGVALSYSVAPTMAPTAYPFLACWEGAQGSAYTNIGMVSIGGAAGTRNREDVDWELFLAVGPANTDRARLQYENLHWKRDIMRAFQRNTTLGKRLDMLQVQFGAETAGSICHKVEVKRVRWSRVPWGKTEKGAEIRHLGWLCSMYTESLFTAPRG